MQEPGSSIDCWDHSVCFMCVSVDKRTSHMPVAWEGEPPQSLQMFSFGDDLPGKAVQTVDLLQADSKRWGLIADHFG